MTSNPCSIDVMSMTLSALFSSLDHAVKFKVYLPSKRLKINFLKRKKKMIVHLFRYFSRKRKICITSIEKRPSEVYSNFKSFIFEAYKIGLIKTFNILMF